MQDLLDTPQEPPSNNQESKVDQIASFSNTKIENWNNDDIIHWITSVNNISIQDYRSIVAEIKDSGCLGEDIMTLESAQDFADAFGINNNASCKALFQSMAQIKKKSDWQLIPIEQWSNKNVLSWINSLNIDEQYKIIMTTTVTEIECTGDDIACLEQDDVGEAFQIDNQIVAGELYTTIQSMKSVNISLNNNPIQEEISENKNNVNNSNNNATPGNVATAYSTPQFFVGQSIECSDGKWYGGKIKNVETNRVLIQFFAFKDDQWIIKQHYNTRIRNPETKQPFGDPIVSEYVTPMFQNIEISPVPALMSDDDLMSEPDDDIIEPVSQPVSDPVLDFINASQPVPEPEPVAVAVEEEKKFVSELNYSWKQKKMRNWSNAEILDWLKCMNLGTECNDKLLNVIEMNECVGEDIVDLKTADDLGDAFEIEDNEICEKISTEIKNFKVDGADDSVTINVLYRNQNILLDEEFVKTDMVSKVKMRFKIQTGINLDNKYIHFRYKNAEILDNNRLESYNIKDENDLIEVRLDNVFPIFIFARGQNITLNEMVTKSCTIKTLKEMYKKQSGVVANIEDILFYNLKQNKLLEANKTLEQCGIVDDKNLITVRFGADGGKE